MKNYIVTFIFAWLYKSFPTFSYTKVYCFKTKIYVLEGGGGWGGGDQTNWRTPVNMHRAGFTDKKWILEWTGECYLNVTIHFFLTDTWNWGRRETKGVMPKEEKREDSHRLCLWLSAKVVNKGHCVTLSWLYNSYTNSTQEQNWNRNLSDTHTK